MGTTAAGPQPQSRVDVARTQNNIALLNEALKMFETSLKTKIEAPTPEHGVGAQP